MLHPPLHLGEVAIEKGAFESPSATVANYISIEYLFYHCDFCLVRNTFFFLFFYRVTIISLDFILFGKTAMTLDQIYLSI